MVLMVLDTQDTVLDSTVLTVDTQDTLDMVLMVLDTQVLTVDTVDTEDMVDTQDTCHKPLQLKITKVKTTMNERVLILILYDFLILNEFFSNL